MSAEIARSNEWMGVAKGLIGKIMLPNNSIALLAHIQSIIFSVKKMGTADPPVTGVLTPANVMLPVTAPWIRDPDGYSFLWMAPGTLWPDIGTYRAVVTFVTVPALDGVGIQEVWQITTKDPTEP